MAQDYLQQATHVLQPDYDPEYLEEPSVSFCAIEDHKYEKAPLQRTEFGEGKEMGQLISKVWQK